MDRTETLADESSDVRHKIDILVLDFGSAFICMIIKSLNNGFIYI